MNKMFANLGGFEGENAPPPTLYTPRCSPLLILRLSMENLVEEDASCFLPSHCL
jgi:hypothetical protein